MSVPAEPDPSIDLRQLLDRVEGWRSQLIPGSTMPVRLWRLHHERPTNASVSLVEFPSGWRRPATGSYTVAEEFVLLEGALEMNGQRFTSGDWVFVPANGPRSDTVVAHGALALAWFGGVPLWRTDVVDETAELAVLRAGRTPADAQLLPPSPPHGGTRIADDEIAASTGARDLLDAERWTWWWLPPDTGWNEPGSRVFVRSW